MNFLKTPQQKLMEEAGMTPASPGMLKTPQQAMLEESGIQPKFFAGGGSTDQIGVQDMLAMLIAAGQEPQRFNKGGQPEPELGVAKAYENKPSEAVRDWFAKRIGIESADRLFGGPRASSEDRLLLQSINPINYATAIADEAKAFYENSREKDYFGAMGHFGLGALSALPFLGKGKTLAQRALSPMNIKENLPNLGIAGATELGPLKVHK